MLPKLIADLIAKSLVIADVGGDIVRYRLLETTRTYALKKLVTSGEFAQLAKSHAGYYRNLFEQATIEAQTWSTDEWLSAYAFKIGNVRKALDWSFSAEGDSELGRALTIAAVPLWFHLSLINECRDRVTGAIASIAGSPDQGTRQEMQLYAALGWSEMYSSGRARETGAAWGTALAIAERLGDTDFQLRSLWGLWAGRINNAELRTALSFAERFRALSTRSSDPADAFVGERMLGATLHFLGDQAGARLHIDAMLHGYRPPGNRSHIVRFQFDQVVTAQYTLARVLWTQGNPEQALQSIENSIQRALAIDHVLSLCNLLAQSACPVALLAGEVALAERYIAMLRQNTRTHALNLWGIYGRLFAGQLSVMRGDVDHGRQMMIESVGELRAIGFNQYMSPFLIALADASMILARDSEALHAIDEALEWSERTGEAWSVPEALRLKGELVDRIGGAEADLKAEECFRRSLEMARSHGALAWELRTAMSVARLRRRQQTRVPEARLQLKAAYERFTEGRDLTDLRMAAELLDGLNGS